MLLSDFIPQVKSVPKKKQEQQNTNVVDLNDFPILSGSKQKKKLNTNVKAFQPTQFKFDDEQVEQVDDIDKLTSIIDIQPLLPSVVIPQNRNTKTSLTKMIEAQEIETQSRQLKFRHEDVSYLFTLLLNETKQQMQEMRDHYIDEKDYLSHVIPLFINENLAYIKSTSEDQIKKYVQRKSTPMPLRYQVRVDRQHTVLGKYLVLEAVEGDFDQSEQAYTWKRTCFSEFQEYSSAKSYIIQLIVKQVNPFGKDCQFVDLLGIIQKQEVNQKHLIYLPWNQRVINAFKIPNIVVESMNVKTGQYHTKLKEGYTALKYPNFEELVPFDFLIHVNPIFSPVTYLIELKALLSLYKSKFLKCILRPQEFVKPNPVSKCAYLFGEPIIEICKKYQSNPSVKQLFNQSQWEAITHATDYSYPMTVISGPPGTGKTFTSLGIMSIVLTEMERVKHDSMILACGHSNTVINDWIRKLTRVNNDSLGLIDFNGNAKQYKVMRIGNADKCDADIYDYCLEVVAQRELFNQYAQAYDKSSVCELITSNKKGDQITLVHIKQKIQSLNERIYDLQDFQENLDQNYQNWITTMLIQMNAQKKELRRLYSVLSAILFSKRDTYKQLLHQHLKGVRIVVSTLTSSASSILEQYLNEMPISLCIIDEAPMCFEPSTLIPITKHQVYKLVLIGDHRQLGPIIFDTTNTKYYNYNRSLYERVIDVQQHCILLNIQYRSMQNLSAVTSLFFYNRLVHDDISIKSMEFPPYLQGRLDQSRNFLFFDVHGGEQIYHNTQNSYFNEYEAWGVVLLVGYLLDNQITGGKVISIITPYRAQVKKIKEIMFLYKEGLMSRVEVDTIDAFQGKENDVMIISLVRSEGLGFLMDMRRANVAISRAQYGQFIFGNSNALIQERNLWMHLYEYMHERGHICRYGQQEIQYCEQYFHNILKTIT